MTKFSPEELQHLWSDWRTLRRRKDRDKLIEHYTYVSLQVASKIHKKLTSYVDINDIRSYAMLGLIDAVERFDPSTGYKFPTYAVWRIQGMVFDELRANDWVPRSVRDRAKVIEQAREDLHGELKRMPTGSELAAKVGYTPVELSGFIHQIDTASLESVEEYVSHNLKPTRISSDGLVDEVAADSTSILLDVREALAQAITSCNEREKVVLTLYYYEGLTLGEIGQWMGVTESRVCQIHTRAMEAIRGALRIAA